MADQKQSSVTFWHKVKIGTYQYVLPIREVAPGVQVALFNPLGDWQVCEIVGKELVKLVPENAHVLIMADGKAQSLLHVVGRESGLKTVVARKEVKPYVQRQVSVWSKSITSVDERRLCLCDYDIDIVRGRNVLMVDDAVSSGGTLNAIKELVTKAGGTFIGAIAVFAEGAARGGDVSVLGNLPLFDAQGNPLE